MAEAKSKPFHCALTVPLAVLASVGTKRLTATRWTEPLNQLGPAAPNEIAPSPDPLARGETRLRPLAVIVAVAGS